jgi:adenosylmethionine-8-amino-7-oxononanoate aminotransferase
MNLMGASVAKGFAIAAEWRTRDLRSVWHPCTQMREHQSDLLPLIPIRRGEGIWLEDYNGKRYLDAISSWWTNLFGHAHPKIAEAIAQQAGQLEHVLLAGFSHAPTIELAERLLARAPKGLSKVFYADNGSSAIEVALKMSFHSHRNQGDMQRHRFVTLSNSYHGETLGALGVSDIPLYRRTYAPLLLQPMFAPSPDTWHALPGESGQACAERAALALDELLQKHGQETCALILEPLIQCAGGMRMYHPHYLRRARQLCDHHGVHLIADEIAVGFGRTGSFYACEQAAIRPDLMCLSKGLTGGALPLAAVLCTQALYDAFLDDSRERAFLHSHSYTGNPLACAAALAVQDIFDSEPVLQQNKTTAERMAVLAAPLVELPWVADVRQTGMVLAIELAAECRRPLNAAHRTGLRAYQHAISQGVVLRPLGDVLYWMPPYCIDADALERLANVTRDAIIVATNGL